MYGQIPEWPNGADCKSVVFRLRWFESIFAHTSQEVLILEKTCRVRKEKFSGGWTFLFLCGSSSVDRALAFQAEGRGFESRLPLQLK